MKRKSAALYDPYLDTLGGGEKHILSILKVLDERGFEISIFWDQNLQRRIEQRFSLHYVNKLKWLPNIFINKKSALEKLRILKNFDIFLYVTDGSYFFSSAKRNFVFCMVPDKKLYDFKLTNKLKTLNYKFISNSHFTKSWLKRWRVKSDVIYPYLDREFIDLPLDNTNKDNIILTIGRFYSHLHSKKQSNTINLFNKLKQDNPLFKDFRLIMAGGLMKEDNEYYKHLEKLVEGRKDISLKVNISFGELFELYRKSLIYIHMTGYGVDENKHPEFVEHLGIAPLEAMASGCLTFCYDAGGLKEIIKNKENGFLFKSDTDLTEQMTRILKNTSLQYQIRLDAKKFVTDNFNYDVFKKRVEEVLL